MTNLSSVASPSGLTGTNVMREVYEAKAAIEEAQNLIRCVEWAVYTTCDQIQKATLLEVTDVAMEKHAEAQRLLDAFLNKQGK